MIRIFITGISGFVGSNLVNFFKGQEGILLFGHSRDKAKATVQYQGTAIQLVDGYSSEIFDTLTIDCIIHLAGIAHDLSNQYKDEDYFQVNDLATRKIYDYFLKSTVKKFIYLSSIKAAIDHYSEPIDEMIKPSPVTAYGKSKLMAEQYIQQQTLPRQKEYFILRPCMIHGPSNKGNLNLLYKFVKSGMPYPFGAFTNQRSFLSVDNLNFILLKLITGSIPSGIYNLADSEPLSTTEVISVISNALKRKPRIWKIPPVLMKIVFKLINGNALQKLTESMVVSNKKVLLAIQGTMPCTAQQGLIKTIEAFDK